VLCGVIQSGVGPSPDHPQGLLRQWHSGEIAALQSAKELAPTQPGITAGTKAKLLMLGFAGEEVTKEAERRFLASGFRYREEGQKRASREQKPLKGKLGKSQRRLVV